jgi:hypothetical protein
MNSYPHFISNVALGKEEHKIHFVALFSENPDAIPLALFHGWPGTTSIPSLSTKTAF